MPRLYGRDTLMLLMAEASRQPWCVPRGSVLPPPRPGVRYVRIRWLGVIIADDDLRRRVDRYFHYPMIVLALLVLPLLILDYRFVHEAHADPNFQPTHDWIWWLTITGLTLIWLAFLVEFIVKIAVAECRIEYVKRNWLDLVIIIIPVLRPLRAAAVARTTRVFTLRGVGFKFARYVFTLVVGLEATDRLLHRLGLKSSEKRRDPERMTRHELMSEVRKLRSQCDAWEQWYCDEQDHVRAQDKQPCPTPAPHQTRTDDAPALQSTPDASHAGAIESHHR